MTRMLRLIIGALFAISLPACVPMQDDARFPRFHEADQWPKPALAPLQLGRTERLALPEVQPSVQSLPQEQLYSFVIRNMPIDRGLQRFAEAYELNLVVDSDVTGLLDVSFREMPLGQALSLMLDSLDYYWEISDGLIRVRSWQTRQFSVNYLRLIRTGAGSSTATVASSTSVEGGGTGGGSGEGDAGTIVIGHEDEVKFWIELEEQVKQLLSEAGTAVINRLSGTIQVSDQHGYVERIGDFIGHINRSIHRQVDIEVRILEVLLEDATALGVDWSRITEVLSSDTTVNFGSAGIVTSPAGGLVPIGPALDVTAIHLEDGGNRRLQAVIQALESQGDVQIVSQPHVRTMNNQTSLIKVGTDRTFFRREQTIDSTSAGSISTATDIPQVVTEGVVLSITPQIGEDGWVMMDISPVVTRVSSVSIVEGPGGVVQSSAPNLDIAQVSSLIRARSGETVVLGGLIQSQDSSTVRGIPGLSRIEPLRRLTGGQYKATQRRELIMILTPVVVGTQS